MDTITISGSPVIIIPLFLAVVGVAGWIGYLIGRVRTLDPRGETLERGPSPEGTIIGGGVMVVLAGLLLSPMVSGGFHPPSDGTGALVVVGALFLVALGAVSLARGIQALRQP